VSVELYWLSKTVVLDWALKKLDGTPASDATVAGVVTKPNQTTAAMGAVWVPADLVWRLTYDPADTGTHGARITATGTADSAEERKFYVKPSLVGAAPLQMDPTTDVGLARLLIPDNDEDHPLFEQDAQITAFLTLSGGDVRLAAAQALDVIASSEAMVSKKIRTQDLATDGPAVAAELRARATELRRQVAEGEGTDDAGFDIVDFDPWLGLRTDTEIAQMGL
jgi:hypothetical protein